MADDAVVIELRAVAADEGGGETDPDRCWADPEPTDLPDQPVTCGDPDVDRLGLCAWHREKLFGLTREPDTPG